METVNIQINGMPLSVPKGISILEAARYAGIEIPTLCYLKDINEIGACRICMVEVKGARNLVTACVYPVSEGMEVFTNTEKVRHSRKTTLELILSTHDKSCLSCIRSGTCELQALCKEFGVDDENAFAGETIHYDFDDSAAHMVRDNNKCILCRRCVAACDAQGISVIGANARGFDTHISSAFDKDLANVSCISCGQCIVNCPTGAIVEKDDTDKVLAAINDPEKFVIVNTAPSIRATLGEAFGMHIGTNVEGKMVAALRRLGFDKVFDTDFAADLTIVEEAHEFLERFQNGGVLPMITSCSPGWIKYCEHYYPELIPHLSTCKSPQQMFGAVMKTYFAEKIGVDPEKIYTLSIMPCVAKKGEREMELYYGEYAGHDIDAVLTTRELVKMIRAAHISPKTLKEIESDSPMHDGTGAGVIFGATGGVMEAALRSAYYLIRKENPPADAFKAVRSRGFNANEGVQEAEFAIGDITVRTAVVSGLGNTRRLLEQIERGEVHYDFVEVMACPGGCVGGGGQPIHDGEERAFERGKRLYFLDEHAEIRYSHENPDIQKLYSEYFGSPLSYRSHMLLHTEHEKSEHDVHQ